MKRMPKKVFAATDDGRLFIKARYAGMHILCLVVDGVPLTFFGKRTEPYISIEQAIEWHEREFRETKNQHWLDLAEGLRRAQERLKSGNANGENR